MSFEVNSRVNYHGSLPQYHGPGKVVLVPGDPEGRGYVVALDSGSVLHNVHAQSMSAEEVKAESPE